MFVGYKGLCEFLPEIDLDKCQILHDYFCDVPEDKIVITTYNNINALFASPPFQYDGISIQEATAAATVFTSNVTNPRMNRSTLHRFGVLRGSQSSSRAKGYARQKQQQQQTTQRRRQDGTDSDLALSNFNSNTSSYSQSQSRDEPSTKSGGGVGGGVGGGGVAMRDKQALSHTLTSTRSENHTPVTTSDELVISDGSTLYLTEVSIDKFVKVVRLFALSQVQSQAPAWKGYASPNEMLKDALEEFFPSAVKHFYSKLLNRIRHDLESVNESKTGTLTLNELVNGFNRLNASDSTAIVITSTNIIPVPSMSDPAAMNHISSKKTALETLTPSAKDERDTSPSANANTLEHLAYVVFQSSSSSISNDGDAKKQSSRNNRDRPHYNGVSIDVIMNKLQQHVLKIETSIDETFHHLMKSKLNS
ncbi:hypothetical protein RFI_03447, partial [Reticulomyxa filosa]